MSTKNLPPKTPISYLQELCARKGITPKYDLMSVEGAVHEPTFVYRVTFGDKTATGTGQSKKKARHVAAKAILEVLLSGQPLPADIQQTSPENDVQEVKTYEDEVPGNPVGALQEMCTSRRWPPPSYNVIEEYGLPHERMFTMACFVKTYVEKGSGKSKKLAKRQASFNMLQKLKDLPGKPDNPNILEDDEDERFVSHKDNKIPSLTPSISQKISLFYKNMKAVPGTALAVLHSSSPSDLGSKCVQLLHEIASEHNFDVTYVEIEEMSKSGKCQCLVQLSTLPVAVCHGTGCSSNEAQVNAAENALDYLKIMTRE